VIIPNCCSTGIGVSASIKKPAMVVIAAIDNAPPVCPMVSDTAPMTSPVLSAICRNLSTACMA